MRLPWEGARPTVGGCGGERRASRLARGRRRRGRWPAAVGGDEGGAVDRAGAGHSSHRSRRCSCARLREYCWPAVAAQSLPRNSRNTERSLAVSLLPEIVIATSSSSVGSVEGRHRERIPACAGATTPSVSRQHRQQELRHAHPLAIADVRRSCTRRRARVTSRAVDVTRPRATSSPPRSSRPRSWPPAGCPMRDRRAAVPLAPHDRHAPSLRSSHSSGHRSQRAASRPGRRVAARRTSVAVA
jgi:hypothetical protein